MRKKSTAVESSSNFWVLLQSGSQRKSELFFPRMNFLEKQKKSNKSRSGIPTEPNK